MHKVCKKKPCKVANQKSYINNVLCEHQEWVVSHFLQFEATHKNIQAQNPILSLWNNFLVSDFFFIRCKVYIDWNFINIYILIKQKSHYPWLFLLWFWNLKNTPYLSFMIEFSTFNHAIKNSLVSFNILCWRGVKYKKRPQRF